MSRAKTPLIDSRPLLLQLRAIPEFDHLRNIVPGFDEATDETITAILEQAGAFAADRLELLNATGEESPPRYSDGRVEMGALHRAVWTEFAEAGWITLDLPVAFGGQGLPLVVAVAVQEIFDRHCSAFGMLAVSTRSAVRLIDTYAEAVIKAEWLPKLVAGLWGATICISEVGAGSDATRMKTRARQRANGDWSITGEKHWISFGGHDLTDRIGHCLLARTEDARGLSLFLVPDRFDGSANGVTIRGIERKLGLHLSPTCAVGFEDATAYLLGEEGRGLAQMFVMIMNMRLSTGAMGLGISSGPADIALNYARDRAQGGSGPAPLAIIEHADVQRQVLDLHARTEMTRGLIYMAAVLTDLGCNERDMTSAREASALAQWLLPLVKTLGGDTAFAVASGAVQVLGGAGYTCDWPVEQALRDARVLTVFEGTTGMQALDLLHRRLWKDEGEGLDIFLAKARGAITALRALDRGGANEAAHVIYQLEVTARGLASMKASPRDAEAGACAFLDLATHAALCWTAARLACIDPEMGGASRLRALAHFHLAGAGKRADMLSRQALLGSERLRAIAALAE